MKDSSSNHPEVGVYLYWIPLGAGAHIVRMSGRVFEAITARIQHRSRKRLYHSALQVFTPEGRYVIEQAPVINNLGDDRGVVAEGAVGLHWLGNFKAFRYEVRCWKEGRIPDLDMAEESPVKITDNLKQSRAIIENILSIPTPVWGRDELKAGEMWNSNSVISWVLLKSGVNITSLHPPRGGRAPGWDAGIEVVNLAK